MATVEERLLPSAEPVQLIDEHGLAHEHATYGMPEAQALVDGYAQLVAGRQINEPSAELVPGGPGRRRYRVKIEQRTQPQPPSPVPKREEGRGRRRH